MAQKELDRFDTKAKRGVQIKTKLIAIIIGSVAVCVAGTLLLTLEIFNSGMVADKEYSLGSTAKGVLQTLSDWNDTLVSGAGFLASNEELAEAVAFDDTETISRLVLAAEENTNADFFAVIGADGTVLPGCAHNIADGTRVGSLALVQDALRGNRAQGFGEFGSFAYAQVALAPVLYEGRTVGCTVFGFDMVDDVFTEQMKTTYNVESTVLKGDTRLSTTLGRDMVGVKVSNRQVIDTVLNKGQNFTGETKIEGAKYYAIYMPLRAGNEVTGAVFVAKSMAVIEQLRNHTFFVVLPIVAAVLLIITLVTYRFVRWLMSRIYNVTNFLKELESGEADLTKRCKLFIRDEIGDLVIHFDLFLDKLQDIIRQLKETKGELSASGTDMTASTEDASSAITQIIANIDGISHQIASQNDSVHQTADAVDDIAHSITQLDGMIEEQSSGVSQASTAIEEMIGNIASVNSSVDKMAQSFSALTENAQNGISKQENVNERIRQIESQSQMLQEANAAISSIASQTNLLAMNAAIEAAHAGEAGKGFSVVADEIRKLSETSSSQSKTIGEQLNNIKDSISEVVSASQESQAAFMAVAGKIRETDMLVAQIKAAMEEQNEGSRQINESLRTMNDSTKEVHAASKDMAGKNSVILREMNTLRDATASMKRGMDEMSVGARKVGDSGTALAEISGNVRGAINKIGSQIDLFKV